MINLESEVLDNARSSSTKYLTSSIYECVNSEWIQLWQRDEDISDSRTFFRQDIELAITYGAILLKVYLARDKASDPEENIFYALRDYNCDPNGSEELYAKRIITYFDIVGFENKLSELAVNSVE